MIEVAEASERILARIGALPAEMVRTREAAGRVLTERLVAPIDSPPWDNSSMDGYAVRSANLSGPLPVRLRVVGEVAAGAFPSRAIESGEAMRIMTGAPVPSGADSVIRREDTDDGRDAVLVNATRDSMRNIRRRAEDFGEGDTLFEGGEVLSIAHLGAIASAGMKEVAVHRSPHVAVISSGNELVELDDFTSAMAGQVIVSSNSITLTALVSSAGGIPADLGIAEDDPASLRARLEQALDTDLIITSAGLSVGDHDYVRDVVAELGGELDFHRVRMRPGAPLAFGMIGDTPWIGLSGNPVSAMVTFELFVRPAIRKMLGMREVLPRTVPVALAEPVTLAAPLMHFLRVIVTGDDAGRFTARLAGSQSSSVLTAMARANALLILPGDRVELAAGEVHRAIPLGESFQLSSGLVLS